MGITTTRRPLNMNIHGFAILDLKPPVAIETMPRDCPQEHRALLHSLATGIGYALDQATDAWSAAFATVGPVPIRLRLLIEETTGGPALNVATVRRGTRTGGREHIADLTLGVRPEAVWEVGLGSTEQLNQLLADVLADALHDLGVPQETASAFADAVKATPPTVALHTAHPPQAVPRLHGSIDLDMAVVSAAERHLAERLRDLKVPTGIFQGLAARDTENTYIAPAALALLNEAIAGYPLAELLTTGLTELERTAAGLAQQRRELHQAVRATPLRYDPVRQAQEQESRDMELRRAITTLLEAALRTQPSGTGDLDRIGWAELLGTASVYVTATFRSERLHHQLAPLTITITNGFEVILRDDPTGQDFNAPDPSATAAAARAYQLDYSAFAQARAAEGLPPAYDGDPADLRPMADTTSQATDPFVGTERIRGAMRAAYGADAVDLLTALFCLATWPVSPDQPVALVSLAEATSYCLDHAATFDGEGHARAALDLLLLRPEVLQAEPWRPWEARRRAVRFETRPILALSDDELYVLPHWCEASASIYSRYLGQGLLPWPDPELPPQVRQALADYRDIRNRRLEEEVADQLNALGYRLRKRIKRDDAQTIGLAALRGEIDILAARNSSDTLWVIEVKDPAEVFTTSEIRRALDRFFDPGEWIDLLMAKTAEVSSQPARVAAALGLAERESWQVRPLMVTRRAVPAAFVPSPVPFTTIGRLSEALQ
jgi:hypothetical protein